MASPPALPHPLIFTNHLLTMKSICNRHRRGLDLMLVLTGVAMLVWVHYRAVGISPNMDEGVNGPLPWAIAIPGIYVLLATLGARSSLASAGRRGYVLSCLGGLCGVGYVALTAIGDLETALAGAITTSSGVSSADGTNIDLAVGAGLMLALLHDIAAHFLYPIIAGIALYAVCSVFENEDASAEGTVAGNDSAAVKVDFARVAEWLDASEAPHAIRLFIEELSKRVTELTNTYQQFAETAHNANEAVRTTATATVELRTTFKEIAASGSTFAADMRELSHGLSGFRRELCEVNGEGERLTQAVGQMRRVVDEMAELASHEILNLSSRTAEVRG